MKLTLQNLKKLLPWALLILALLVVGYGVIVNSLKDKELRKVYNTLSVSQAELYGYEIVETENVTLRKLLRERDEPLILVKPEYIIETRVEVVEVEKVVTIPVSPEGVDYTYTWDSGIPVAQYSYDGYEHKFTTPQITFDIETEVDDELTSTLVYATSSADLSQRFLLNSTTRSIAVREDGLERLSLPPWVWVTGGALLGGATVAGSVKLAKGL